MNANRRPTLDGVNDVRYAEWIRRSARQMAGKANHARPYSRLRERQVVEADYTPRHRAEVAS